MREQSREMEEGGRRAKRKGWGIIIVEPEKEMTLLLSHYHISGGTNRFNSERGGETLYEGRDGGR